MSDWDGVIHRVEQQNLSRSFAEAADDLESWALREALKSSAHQAVHLAPKILAAFQVADRLRSADVDACRHGVSGRRCDCCYGELALAAAASGGDVKQAPGEAPQSGPAQQGNAQGKALETLKPCPFGCDGEPRPTADVDMRPEFKGHIYGYTIFCETCGISMSDEDYETVAEAWNERRPA